MVMSMIGAVHRAQAWHTRGIESMEHRTVHDLLDPVATSDLFPLIENKRTRRVQTGSILRWLFALYPTAGGPGKENIQLFLSCEQSMTGGTWVITYARRHAVEAEKILSSLSMYAMQALGISEEAKDAVLKCLSDTGVENYMSTDWDEKTKTAIPLAEREQEEELKAFELEWGGWVDDEKPTATGGKNEETATGNKRPLPKDKKDTFDDKSLKTTATQKTLKGQLMGVDLSGTVPSSEELEAEETRVEAAKLVQELKGAEYKLIMAKRKLQKCTPLELEASTALAAGTKAVHDAKYQGLMAQQSRLFEQAEADKLCNEAVRNLQFADNVEADMAATVADMEEQYSKTGLIPPHTAQNMEELLLDEDGNVIKQGDLNETMRSDMSDDDALAASGSSPDAMDTGAGTGA
jgi:hypothetical protein